jgi:protein-L-isoaspartate(D-aspartate) O-methyltransferase
MLEAMELSPADRVLEVGTGSGYVTALLAELVAEVVSIERHKALAERSRELLAGMGYANVKVIVGDGNWGFTACAPYDAIIVSAAAAELPPALLSQLSDRGRMIIPVGPADSQQLQMVRMEGGRAVVTFREACRFVPLVSEVGGWKN